jgi:hypothetical protein
MSGGSASRLTRRDLLQALGVGTVAASAGLVAGCAAGGPLSGPATGPPAGGRVGAFIMIIRHGEKPSDDDSSPGIDPDGTANSHSLTARGWARARALADLFAPPTGAPRPGLARPTAIYAAGGSGGEGLRTRETVAALAARLGVSIDTRFSKGDETALAHEVAGHDAPTLICWQHGEIPTIATAFTEVTPSPPASWPDDRYDLVWTISPTDGGWSFHQIPELLLSGDSKEV